MQKTHKSVRKTMAKRAKKRKRAWQKAVFIKIK